jgi:hypothetical protein
VVVGEENMIHTPTLHPHLHNLYIKDRDLTLRKTKAKVSFDKDKIMRGLLNLFIYLLITMTFLFIYSVGTQVSTEIS